MLILVNDSLNTERAGGGIQCLIPIGLLDVGVAISMNCCERSGSVEIKRIWSYAYNWPCRKDIS